MKKFNLFDIVNFFNRKKRKAMEEILKLIKEYKPEKVFSTLFNMVISGNMFDDFYKFTNVQSGGKSADPNDPAAKFPPSIPDKDGKYYHTVKDVTFKTFVDIAHRYGMTADPKIFYEMPEYIRKIIVKDFIIAAKKYTQSDLVNYAIAYFLWGGSAKKAIDIFVEKFGNLKDYINTNGELKTFNNLMYLRILQLQKLNPRYAKGWTTLLLCYWNVFKQYAKN